MAENPTQLEPALPFSHSARSSARPSSRGALRVAGYFAGVGGLELGLQRGLNPDSQPGVHETVALCEYDKGARAVLAGRFPRIPLVGDVRDVESLHECDLLAAGFPCQDLSQAGRTAGIDGTQSGLIQRLFALIEKARRKPEWILLENVPFMLQLDRGKGMTYLVRELGRLGYRWAYRVIDARSLGLPQRRKRVVLLAARTHSPEDVLLSESASVPPEPDLESAAMCGFYWTEGLRGLGWAVEAVPTLKGGSSVGIPSPPAIWDRQNDLIGTPSIEDAEELQGFARGWTAPAVSEGGVRPGFRWRLVGNAVNVRVSQWVGQRIAGPREYDSTLDQRIEGGYAWPSAAWGNGDKWYRSEATTWVPGGHHERLSDFLSDPITPLSRRATAGFRSRLERSSLRIPPGFLDAISAHERKMRG